MALVAGLPKEGGSGSGGGSAQASTPPASQQQPLASTSKWSDDVETSEVLKYGPGSERKEDGDPIVDREVARKAAEAEKVALMLGHVGSGGQHLTVERLPHEEAKEDARRQQQTGGGNGGGTGGSSRTRGGKTSSSSSTPRAVALLNYFSEELPTAPLQADLTAVLNQAGDKQLVTHGAGWFDPSHLIQNRTHVVPGKRAKNGKNVVFIKVAKAGGTTLQEMFQRYATELHLTVATPEHVKKETSFHRGKANILSRHCTLPNFLELKFISRPYFFVTILRDPLSLAVSMFYWKHQEKRAAPYKYMRRFRQESSFSDRHKAHIHVFASQDEELRGKLKDYGIYGYLPQYAWFGDTVKNAIKELVMREFLIGLVHRFDHLVVMLRYRLGVDVRAVLGVTTNHYRHPKAREWPAVSLATLNNTGKLQADWKFMRAAERVYNRQVREFGSARLASEVREYKVLMRNLRAACDPEGKEFRSAERFLPRCKPGQGQCIFDAAATVKCMLQKYDGCAVGTNAGNGHCEREVRVQLAAEELEQNQLGHR